ncbi:MAG: gephyrin-like molybdotransferase Glp [Myxococcota bacterium]|nr:gephyrin-like molybdotransferase Glp [Myxococcota bacterium]
MLSFEDALARCLDISVPRRKMQMDLNGTPGRYLSENLYTPQSLPYWDNSAMDGYAICRKDISSLPCQLEIVDVIPAGKSPSKSVKKGEAARIMTGAPLPEGADTVVIQENTTGISKRIIQIESLPTLGANIRRKGEELQEGMQIASKGDQVNIGLVGLCAALGLPSLPVYQPPKVALIATGDELRLRDQQSHLHRGEIWSSNTLALQAAVQEAGGEVIDCGIARDSTASITESFRKAQSLGADLIVSTGGVSVGDYDLVKDSLSQLGASIHFWKVRMKPGKPLALGSLGPIPIFGLPGNPVSCLVSFWMFVRPILRRALGAPNIFLPTVPVKLGMDIHKKHGRTEFVRVTLSENRDTAFLTGNQSSAWLSSIAKANALIKLPANTHFYPKGTTLDAILIPDS